MLLNILIFIVLSILIPNAFVSLSIGSMIVYWRTKEIKMLTLPIAYYIMHNMLDYVHESFTNYGNGDDAPDVVTNILL